MAKSENLTCVEHDVVLIMPCINEEPNLEIKNLNLKVGLLARKLGPSILIFDYSILISKVPPRVVFSKSGKIERCRKPRTVFRSVFD